MIIPVSRPHIGAAEITFVNEALQAGAISGLYGTFLDRFETEFAEFCGSKYAVTVSNGTTALHLALAAAGVGKDDEVLVATTTNMASFFAVLYLGAKPVPVDISRPTLTMDPEDLARKISPRSRAIMVVHLFGQPTDMDPINELARQHNLVVIEDCAEAHGAVYKGRTVGSIGHIGCFSFFANKIVTTGEGGMLTTDDPVIAEKARSLKALAFGKRNKFMHTDIGFNYRMTNVQAAIGCGQMSVIDWLVERRREIGRYYSSRLSAYSDYLDLPVELPGTKNVIWMYHLVLKGILDDKRSAIMAALQERGIETREGFIPYNLQDIFVERGWTAPEECPVANQVAFSSFYLPTSPVMTDEELEYVATNFISILDAMI
ncbi:MAG: DegT/DnrJ/EryC1/StrS family aminotransferase [Brevundimonas sp.]|uniref:DegT/DnrJ/EryC1/StrS family aminotransferase n=1 Tax=Brevundimonas sp. TaxID=1871086 RepID=UPI0027354313|nr:DegT/DnrJ/EryC1/StrS family aminotransferase [Brevundimonas sp.]MDP3655587.1 DegT/DnrJ/EryC1/StrS family aminotransferase [Brevundimonas sp.]MDZ4110652.1 DegT/DnrJ/EryC1/StrS family aminotransferase [Brevundimonas sp.]